METDLIEVDESVVVEEVAPERKPPSKGIRKAIRWITYLAAFLIPLWFLPFTADIIEINKQFLLAILAGVGLVLYLIDVVKSGMVLYRKTTLYWAFGALVIAGIVATIASVGRYASIFGNGINNGTTLVTMVSYAVLFFLAYNTSEDSGHFIKNCIKVSMTLAILLAILPVLGVSLLPGQLGKIGFSTVGTFDSLIILAAALLPIFLTSARPLKGAAKTIIEVLGYVAVAGTLALLIIVNWWALWVVAFISLGAYVAFNVSHGFIGAKMRLFAIPLCIIVIGVLELLFGFTSSLQAKLPIEIAPSTGVSYKVGLAALQKRPLGYGMSNFAIAFDLFKPQSSANTSLFQLRFTEGSSEFASALAEGGIIMVVAILLFVVFLLRALWRALRNRFGDDTDQGKLWASILGLVAIFFFFPVSITSMAVLALLLAVGLLGSMPTDETELRTLDLESDTRMSLIGSVAFIVSLVIVVVTGYFLIAQYRGNVLFARATHAPNIDAAITAYVASINANSHDDRVYRALSQQLLTQINNSIQDARKNNTLNADFTNKVQSQLASAVNVSVRATEINPADSENWMNRAFVYQNIVGLVSGADALSADMYKEALNRNPHNPLAYTRLGNLYLALADTLARSSKNPPQEVLNGYLDRAETNFQQAIALYNNYGQALYNLAATYDRKGQLPQAIKQFERLAAGNPRDPSIVFQLGLLYYRNNQKDEAMKAWERSVVLFPNYSNARWYLSFVYEERGDLDKALAQVQEVQKFNKDNALVQQRMAQLEDGIRTIPPERLLDKKPL